MPGGFLANPVIAEPLLDSLLDGLLRAIDHPYREALNAPVQSWGPGTVRRGVDTIDAFPQRPLTMAALAADAGVNVRVLDECWRRHRDVQPMRYLRNIRLAHAHLELLEHAPGKRRSPLPRSSGASCGPPGSRPATSGVTACPRPRPCAGPRTPERRGTLSSTPSRPPLRDVPDLSESGWAVRASRSCPRTRQVPGNSVPAGPRTANRSARTGPTGSCHRSAPAGR